MPPKRTREGEEKVPAESADAVVDTAAADATALVHLRGTEAGAPPPPVECRLVESRGRALVASRKIEKGAVFMSERPIAAVQAVANRAAFAACAHCLAPVGLGATHHLALACGATTRRDLVAAVSSPQGWGRIKYDKPTLPRLSRDEDGALVPCRRARGGCAEVFCSARCRADAEGWHALVCVGHCEEGSPMYEFRRHAMRTHESFLLAANAAARALADAGASDCVGAGEAGRSADEKTAFDPRRDASLAAAVNVRALTALCAPREPWWETAARVAGLEDPDAGSRDPKRSAKYARRLERRAETLREQIEDAWQLLEMSWVRMRNLGVDAGTGEPTPVAPLLTFDAFHRLVAAVDNTVLPVGDEHPGAAYARRALKAEAGAAEMACRALDGWLDAIGEGGVAMGHAGDGSEDESEEDEGSSEDESSDSDESGPGTPGRSNEDDDEDDEDSESEGEDGGAPEPNATRRGDWTERGPVAARPAPVSNAKGAGMLDVVERASAKLPRLAALALAPGVALVNHSCLPNCQVEITRGAVDDAEEGDDEKTGEKTKKPERGADCGSLRVSLLALRDISPGEELTVGYVPVTQDIASRRADLVARHGFVCSCARCVLESGADGANPSVADMKRLADQAQEEARYEDAEAAARFVLKSDPTDGDAHHKIGTAMLGQGRWADAHAAWREGVAVAPDHPALSSQAAKDEAYAPGVPAADQTLCSVAFESVHDGGIWATPESSPLMTEAECAEWVRLAEKAGEARGGWTTSRHYAVPTTDIPVHAIPDLLPLWNRLMRDKLASLLSAACPDEMPKPSSVRVHDAFVVRYEAGAQHHLPMHVDQSAVSVTLALNDEGEYEGGGTTFAAPVGKTVRPGRGHVVAFKGGLQHGGSPVTRGVRYIVAAFLFAE